RHTSELIRMVPSQRPQHCQRVVLSLVLYHGHVHEHDREQVQEEGLKTLKNKEYYARGCFWCDSWSVQDICRDDWHCATQQCHEHAHLSDRRRDCKRSEDDGQQHVKRRH